MVSLCKRILPKAKPSLPQNMIRLNCSNNNYQQFSSRNKNIFSCETIEELNKLLNTIKSQRIFLLFYASLIKGKSWCPDCIAADPIIDRNMKYLNLNDNNDTFITVYVGDRATWKDSNHILRHDSRFNVTGVPTILLYDNNKKQRLVELECHNTNLVRNLFQGNLESKL